MKRSSPEKYGHMLSSAVFRFASGFPAILIYCSDSRVRVGNASGAGWESKNSGSVFGVQGSGFLRRAMRGAAPASVAPHSF